jgi:hypothetical protein
VKLELTHVGHVEQADTLADGAMFLEDPFVLNRHLPSPEVDHLCPQLSVQRIEGGSLEGRRFLGKRHEEPKLAHRWAKV